MVFGHCNLTIIRYGCAISIKIRNPLKLKLFNTVLWAAFCEALGIGTHLLIVGLLSKFDKAGSTLAQRGWIVAWFVDGSILLFLKVLSFETLEAVKSSKGLLSILNKWHTDHKTCFHSLGIFLLAVVSVPPIGGFVTIALMIKNYGDCSHL